MTLRSLLYALLLLMPTSLFGQDALSSLLKTFNQHQDCSVQEKIFIHTDRTFYLTGDYIWLKAYLTDGTYHTPIDLSKVVYIEVIDHEKKITLHAKIEMDHGVGNTCLFLPASLNSGKYQIRAYTRWMQNFPPDFFFHKTIDIVNPFKPLSPSAAGKSTYDVQFFPEGGNFITGIETKIAFRVVNEHGEGIPFRGNILNQHGEIVASFIPLKFGIGHFMLTPQAGDTYRAEIRDVLDHVIATRELPTPLEEGYSLRLKEEGNTISAQVSFHSASGHSPEMVYLLAHSRGNVEATDRKVIQQNTAQFILNKKELHDGISHITIFDENKRPVCERLYFNMPTKTLPIDSRSNRKQYGPRQPVSIDIATQGVAGVNLSMSVYRLDSLQSPDTDNIVNYLFLTSELRGTIESPEFYFSNDKDVKEATDNLMLTHGWRRFTWQDILSGVTPEYKYIPEHENHIITAHVTKSGTTEPGVNIPVYLSVPGKQFILKGAKSNKKGEVLFELNDFYGPRRLIVQTNSQIDSMYSIHVNNPFSTHYVKTELPPFVLNSELKDQLITRSIDMQMENAYFDQRRAVVKPGNVNSTLFYGKPDQQFHLDDYTRFPAMEDVMREYVPGVIVRKRKEDFYFLVINKNGNNVFREDPLMLIDGVPVFNTNKIMEYDPLKVQQLDVITSRYFYGALSFQGIVSYTTYHGDLPGLTLYKNAVSMDYEGVQLEREFFSPVYETPLQKKSRLPDRRNLLYWSPGITTDLQGKSSVQFYTSDRPGKYYVHIQGISKDGIPGSRSFTFDVMEENN